MQNDFLTMIIRAVSASGESILSVSYVWVYQSYINVLYLKVVDAGTSGDEVSAGT